MPTPAVEAVAAGAPAAAPTAASGGEGAARVAAADAVGTVASSGASRGITEKWGAELPLLPAPVWGSAVGAKPAPRGDALAEERGRPFKAEVVRTL